MSHPSFSTTNPPSVIVTSMRVPPARCTQSAAFTRISSNTLAATRSTRASRDSTRIETESSSARTRSHTNTRASCSPHSKPVYIAGRARTWSISPSTANAAPSAFTAVIAKVSQVPFFCRDLVKKKKRKRQTVSTET